MECVEKATREESIQTLRNVALLALHSLFEPDRGNLTQLVSLASRLCIDLGIYRSHLCSLTLIQCSQRGEHDILRSDDDNADRDEDLVRLQSLGTMIESSNTHIRIY
jgi:hypothetical protein